MLAERSAELPNARLVLEFVYGYQGKDNTSQNLFYTSEKKVCTAVAALLSAWRWLIAITSSPPAQFCLWPHTQAWQAKEPMHRHKVQRKCTTHECTSPHKDQHECTSPHRCTSGITHSCISPHPCITLS